MKRYKIGYTTGTFDLFHIGHLNILKKSKEMCDFLIVGVSTDEVVQSYKHKVPVIPFKDRVEIIKSIRYVDQDAVSIKRKKTASGSVIPRLAKANLQRNKRRTVFIVISLTLSIVFLNSVFIFSSSFDEDVYIENQTRSDFRVYSPVIQAAWGDNFGHDSAVPEKAVEEIKEQPGVTNEAYLYRNTFEDDQIGRASCRERV